MNLSGQELTKKIVFQQLSSLRGEVDALSRVLFDYLADEPQVPQNVPNEPTPESDDVYFSAQELAERFKVSTATIYRWAREGRFPHGREWGPRTRRWSAAELEGTDP